MDCNSDILICQSDKTKNVNVIRKDTYIKKLDEVFSSDKFQRLKINPINTDLQKLRVLINNFKPFLTNKEQFKVIPIETLKRGYGIIKNHKKGLPLRPIVSSCATLTTGVETYLQDLISPINKSCKFSVDSTLTFKNKISDFIQTGEFNSEVHEVVSYDCQSLFTSINIKRVLNFILDTIYSDTEKFFPKRTKTVKILKEIITKQVQIPPRDDLETFFLAILTKFSTFEALNGFFRQTSGVSMGGKMSPSLANIFCHMFEMEIIENEIKNGSILAYYRYVDDILVILKKGKKIHLLEKLNRFDKNLGFTMENTVDNKLNFLDTTLIINNNNLHLEHFRKPTATDCMTNYKTAVFPKSYKIGAFIGELYRCNHSTTTDEARDRAINKSKKYLSEKSLPP